MQTQSDTIIMEKIVSLAKRRGFIFPGSEIYGGLSGTWDYGPLGVELRNNVKREYWREMVYERDDIVGLDAAIMMNPKVWEASGHTKLFNDPLVECSVCKNRWRVDALDQIGARNPDGSYQCPTLIASRIKGVETIRCSGKLSDPRQFNLLVEAKLGA
ncbi:MAG: glycine--tRNA ligase, partial [Patescibacteria group bacterium]